MRFSRSTELVMSYFESYFNPEGEKTLRGYTMPLNLRAFDGLEWTLRDEPLELIAHRLDEILAGMSRP